MAGQESRETMESLENLERRGGLAFRVCRADLAASEEMALTVPRGSKVLMESRGPQGPPGQRGTLAWWVRKASTVLQASPVQTEALELQAELEEGERG